MVKNKKFYEFRNQANDTLDIYMYGVIVSGGNDTKWCETDVTFQDFKEQLENSKANVINIYANSPGGSVFTANSIVAMLSREKAKGKTINAYVDGLAASAASYLIMVADNIYTYKSSVLMIHKPLIGFMFGANADDLRKTAEQLDVIENGSLIPMYMAKAKETLTEDKLKEMLSNETWMDATEMQKYFNIELLEDSKEIAACLDMEMFKSYKNTPEELFNVSHETVNQEVEYNEAKQIEYLKAQLELEIEL